MADAYTPIEISAEDRAEAEANGARDALRVAAFVNTLHHELRTLNGSGISLTPEYLAVIANNYTATVLRPVEFFEAEAAE